MGRWRRLSWPIIALSAVALTAPLWAGGYLTLLESQVADAGARLLQHEVASDIVIIGIDAQSLADLPQWPWPRRYHARLIDRLAQAAPDRVFIDIDFSALREPGDDALLEAALAGFPGQPIILPAFFQQATGADARLLFTQPIERLARHATLASVNLKPGADGLVRDSPASWSAAGTTLPSVAGLITGLNPTPASSMLIDYSIAPSSFRFVSYADVLEGRIDMSEFRSKIVYVGATAVELGDNMPVPVFRSLPGIVVQALATETARQGVLRTLPGSVYLTLLIAWAMLCTALLLTRSWRRNLLVLISTLVTIALVALYAFTEHRVVLEVVPFWLVTAASFLLITLRSLDRQTLRALAYGMGLRNRDALLKSVVESSIDAIICIDRDGRIRMANLSASQLLRCDADALRGARIAEYIPGLGQSQTMAVNCLREFDARTSTGDEFPVELSISRVRRHEEHLYTIIVRDIRERRAQRRHLEYQATHDPLTTLPNRVALGAHLDTVLATSGEHRAVGLLMLDLCRFKEVNDTLGHHVGDFVLYEVARRFRETAGKDGFVARIGGDEFTVVIQDVDGTAMVDALCERLHDSLKSPIDADGIAIDVGLSIGIATYPADARNAASLLQRADIAMYAAKRRASRFERYDAAQDQNSLRKLTMVGELRAAIATDGIVLHYQPQIDLRSRRATSVEALLRWHHPTFGMVSPSEFVPIAEATDLIHPLTDWTLREALKQITRWNRAGLELRVAVNLSARLLQDTGFPAHLSSLLQGSRVRPASLELEITESAMMLDPERALQVVRQIHELGVRVAIDDFGTGYSSLAYLRDLPVHALKLDKSFVIGVRARADNRVIVESTVQMAHALKIEVVAEGVGDDWTVQLLSNMSYDYGQGHYYSPALPADQCLAWITQFNAAQYSSSVINLRAAG